MPSKSVLLRPRRIVAAAALFLALSGGLGGLLGAVAAADGPEPPRDGLPFTLAAPHSGDHGAYHVVPVPGHTMAEALAATQTVRSVEFQWLDDQVMRHNDGRAQWANMVRVVEREAGDAVDRPARDSLFALVPGSPAAFVRVYADAEGGVAGAHGAGVGSGTGETTSSHLFAVQDYDPSQTLLPCGLRSPLAGTTLQSLDEALPVTALCRGGPGWRDGAGRALLPRSAQAAQDGTSLLEAEEADVFQGRELPVIGYLYREDVPYPLRVQPEGAPYALELQSFARGSRPVRSAPEVVDADGAPPLAMAPRDPTGPSESGASHPYPLSAAYRDALEAEDFAGLRDFVRSHPGAYVAEASYRDLVSNGRDGTWHMWDFTVTDGLEALRVDARHIVRDSAAGTDPLGTLPDQSSHDHDAEMEDAAGRFPRPAQAPAEMPTVASLWAAWQAFAGPDHAGHAPNMWGFSVRCGPACDAPDVRYEAGYTRYNRTYAAKDTLPFVVVLPANPVDNEVRSLLAWDGDALDHPAQYEEQRVDWRRAGQGEPPASEVPAPRAAHATAVAGLWAMPGGREVAAAGLGALLASLLYWAWPALKAGPAALFSRVKSEDLLDNPLRAQVFQRIEAEPGIHHQALVRAVGRGQGAVEHHLRKLLDGGLVTRVQGSRYTCYFPRGRVDRRAMAAAPLLKSPVARSILDQVRSSPGIRSADLARALSVAPATIHYHVERLRAAGLLEGSLAQGAMRLRPVAEPA